MKRMLLAFITLAVATAFGTPAFTAITDAKTKAECEKAGGVWIEETKHPINAIHGLDHRLILIAGVNFVAAENRQISAAGIYTSSPPGWFWRYLDVVAAVLNAKYGCVSSVGP